MGIRDLPHATTHLVIRHEIVAQKNQERIVVHGGRSLQHRVTEAQRLILIDERYRQRSSVLDTCRKVFLATRTQELF